MPSAPNPHFHLSGTQVAVQVDHIIVIFLFQRRHHFRPLLSNGVYLIDVWGWRLRCPESPVWSDERTSLPVVVLAPDDTVVCHDVADEKAHDEEFHIRCIGYFSYQ